MKKWINNMQARLVVRGVEIAENVKAAAKDERGGVSPIVVVIGLALLLLGIIIAFSGTLRTEITKTIGTVITNMESLNQ